MLKLNLVSFSRRIIQQRPIIQRTVSLLEGHVFEMLSETLNCASSQQWEEQPVMLPWQWVPSCFTQYCALREAYRGNGGPLAES